MKRKSVLIIIGMILVVVSLIGVRYLTELNNKEEKVMTNSNDNKIVSKASKSKEKKEKIKSFDLISEIYDKVSYEKIGNYNFLNDILFTDNYSSLEGILTFRGNNLRNTAAYGISKISNKKLIKKWSFTTSSSSWGEGAGWTGQPSIVRWNKELRNNMNIYDKFKRIDGFTEVIYSSLDGNIYFLDLKSGEKSRDSIKVGNPIKGSLSVDTRGIPLLYVGEGINEIDVTGFNIYSLINGEKLYELNGYDNNALRRWPAFDSSALVNSQGDVVIEGGENGLVYVMKLNTNYNKDENKVSIDPEVFRYKYTTGTKAGRLGIESSVAAYANLIFFADNNGDIHCVDLRTMEPKWILNGNDDTDASITIEIENEVPFLYTGDEVDHQGDRGVCTIKKINGLSGEVIWKKEYICDSIIGENAINGGLLATNIIGKNKLSNMVIFSIARYDGFNSGAIIAMNKEDGQVIWKKKLDNYVWSSPVDFYDDKGNGYIIQCDSMGNMFLIDGRNGSVLDKINLGSNIEASPAIFEDVIVVATRGGEIFGIDIK